VQPIELLIILVAVCVGLGLVARWLRIPYPILLVVGGLVLSVQPWVPPVPPLDPSLVFLLFLPPLLYAGAFTTDWRAFRNQLRPITLLSVGLVLFTAAVVAAVAHYAAGMSWATGFVLGAIVAPPDAVAAMAVTKFVRVPRVMVTIIEGESLVNDASALVALRLATAAVLTGAFDLGEASVQLLLVGGGGLLLGLAGGVAACQLHRWLGRTELADSKLAITITLLTPYAVYLPAEHLHVSGVLATVAAGLWVGHRAERVFPPELLREGRAVWEWVEFLLNSLIFILIGFQLPVVLTGLREYPPETLAGLAAAVAAGVVVARLVWMFPGAYVPRWLDRKIFGCGDPYPPWQNVVVIGWTGMRGVVSLAAALAVPMTLADGRPFPDRDLIVFVSFWVIFATLVGQGLTLPLLIRLLGVDRRVEIDDPDPAERVSC
jgi:CPA1 family monovalent cation:H+ antiporter